MGDNHKIMSYRMLLLIATPKLVGKAAGLFKEGNVPVQYIFHGQGTATSQVMDMLGLDGVDKSKIVIGYEPVWSIGPGKTPADKDYITKIARFVKERTGGMDVVYGGGLKADNAAMLASIDEIDGGLIALTRFQGEIGFYPEEYLEIIRLYLGK